MTKYNVHLYREMRLYYPGIEATSAERAAEIARDKPTEEANDFDACDGETFAALVDVAGVAYAESRMIDFAPERQRKAVPALLEALTISRGIVQWAVDHDADPVATAAVLKLIEAAIAEATAASTLPEGVQPYSVLLLYPDYANDSGTETYYTLVEAADPFAAIAEARRRAVGAQEGTEIEPDDFVPLLVTAGHHRSESLFDK
jgi:hypothetical protein